MDLQPTMTPILVHVLPLHTHYSLLVNFAKVDGRRSEQAPILIMYVHIRYIEQMEHLEI
jgi:hypothetical protein